MSQRNHLLNQTFFDGRLSVTNFKTDYIYYLTKINKTQVPDLVIAFNGQAHNPDWAQVLTFLTRINIPTCFTSPDETDFEMSKQAITANYRGKLTQANRNPFASLRHCIDPWSPHLIYRPSQFIYAFQGARD